MESAHIASTLRRRLVGSRPPGSSIRASSTHVRLLRTHALRWCAAVALAMTAGPPALRRQAASGRGRVRPDLRPHRCGRAIQPRDRAAGRAGVRLVGHAGPPDSRRRAVRAVPVGRRDLRRASWRRPGSRAMPGTSTRSDASCCLRRRVAAESVVDGLDGLARLLADGRVSRFAIANPAHAPYGRAAEAALRRRGLWTALQPRLVLGENVSQAAQFAHRRQRRRRHHRLLAGPRARISAAAAPMR